MRILATLSFVILSGCATGNSSMYEWGGYQPALINYYKNQDNNSFEAKLRDALAKGLKSNKVAPGLNAELGYLLFAKGEFTEASKHFALEKDLFPESMLLMDKMIAGSDSAQQNKGASQ